MLSPFIIFPYRCIEGISYSMSDFFPFLKMSAAMTNNHEVPLEHRAGARVFTVELRSIIRKNAFIVCRFIIDRYYLTRSVLHKHFRIGDVTEVDSAYRAVHNLTEIV